MQYLNIKYLNNYIYKYIIKGKKYILFSINFKVIINN